MFQEPASLTVFLHYTSKIQLTSYNHNVKLSNTLLMHKLLPQSQHQNFFFYLVLRTCTRTHLQDVLHCPFQYVHSGLKLAGCSKLNSLQSHTHKKKSNTGALDEVTSLIGFLNALMLLKVFQITCRDALNDLHSCLASQCGTTVRLIGTTATNLVNKIPPSPLPG